MEAEKEKFDLKAIWSKDKDAIKEDAIAEAYEELMIEAEASISRKKKAVRTAKTKLKAIFESAQKSPNFEEMHTARLVVKEAELDLSEAIELYRECFHSDPKMS